MIVDDVEHTITILTQESLVENVNLVVAVCRTLMLISNLFPGKRSICSVPMDHNQSGVTMPQFHFRIRPVIPEDSVQCCAKRPAWR
jgi:hypothetical protein